MYDELAAICRQLASDASVRVACIRGAGGEAFVAGTDIEQFREFKDGEDGIAYEKVIDERIALIEALPMPTIAVIDGWAIGGGIAISAACDFRIATPKSSFGVPIARTLGNCLSPANVARLVAGFGAARAKRMLLLAETISAAEAQACGFVTQIAEADQLHEAVGAICKRLLQHAPVTMRVSKEAIHRVVRETVPEGADLIRAAYGSRDFRIGVEAFLAKEKPQWSGS
jgi:enoyl-CoA hydratase/carnithine racemase